MAMVTRTCSTPRATTPSGRSRPTSVSTSAVAPEIVTGRVSIETRPARASASPSTVTRAGWTSTEVISTPASGVPLTTGFTGSVLVASWLPIWMVTRTALGWTSTPSTTLPLASTAWRPTVSLTSRPDGSIRTRATAATTNRAKESGPETVTGILGDDRVADVEAGRDGAEVDAAPGPRAR